MKDKLQPLDIAEQWLRDSLQKWQGPMDTWTDDQTNNYFRDLGMLASFVIDCWPKNNP